MQQLSCPSCGAEAPFRTASTLWAVCPYCQSLLVRGGAKVENLGKVAALQDETTALQLGTRGKVKGVTFSLVGRLQRSWGEGFWSEWYAEANGKGAWLSEAQGLYYYMLAYPVAGQLPDPRRLKVEDEIQIGGKTWVVQDIKTSKVVSCEGEFPEKPPLGEESLSLDLGRDDTEFATLELVAGAAPSFFAGASYEYDELTFTNVRKIDGW